MSTSTRPLTSLLNSSGSLHPNSSSTSLISRSILSLADPPPHSVDCHLFDLVVNESIRQLVESTTRSRQKRQRERAEIESDLKRLGFDHPPPDPNDDDDERDEDRQVKDKIERIGFRLGYAIAERLSRDRPRFPAIASSSPASSSSPSPSTPHPPVPEPLELIKFVCKDVWTALFDKQVDNLRTNHRGVYVLLENRLRFLERLSPSPGGTDRGDQEQVHRWSQFLLKLPEGVIRGSLANLGIQVAVTSESSNLPQGSLSSFVPLLLESF
ncbi:hypothetical protein JCM3766R1_002479 [Sporobolomyces carnicolor]